MFFRKYIYYLILEKQKKISYNFSYRRSVYMNWIWLDDKRYPDFQLNYSNENSVPEERRNEFGYCVAEFSKGYRFPKKIKRAFVKISADNCFHLFINGRFIGMGPVLPGGDFLCKRPAPKHYMNEYEIDVDSDKLDFSVDVRLLPYKVCDYSRNHGGLAIEAEFETEDGEKLIASTDESWLGRRKTGYTGFTSFDSTAGEDEFVFAESVSDIWSAEKAPIPMLHFEYLCNENFGVEAGEEKEFAVEIDKIYGAYPIFVSDGKCRIEFESDELKNQKTGEESIVFGRAGEYFSFAMHSIGYAKLRIKNTDDKPVNVGFKLLAAYYPVEKEGSFRCSDEGFNKVYDVCKHTLKICRQTIHLDSTKHQELLACTGDYYIDALMTLYMFGDMRLAEFDVQRTADWLKANCGRMFHTTYSLIWVQMLRDVYMITGNKSLLENCEDGLDILLRRFDSYMGGSGLIEYPPDFMFIDWTVVDGYSMHHPPKALGQTVLNAFYYEALNAADYVYSQIGRSDKSEKIRARMIEFKAAFNRDFFDADKKLYFDGKSDPYLKNETYEPTNSPKKYFTKYPNILACLYGLADKELAIDIMERIIFNDEMQDIQPYFMHYMICAVRKLGLFGKYGLKLLDRWKKVVEECDKGLAEGWIAPEPSYSFDHSHAWGGTVSYQLPSAFSGMKIIEPGMKKLSFEPDLWGLDSAEIVIPSAYGEIKIRLEKGRNAEITVPKEIEIISIK